MTPNVKIFQNVFPDSSTGHQNTFHVQIWWESAVAKLLKGRLDYHIKILALCGTPPILPRMGRSSPRFPERCHPLTCLYAPNLVRIDCELQDLLQKN